MNEYYTDEQIATLMGITLKALRNKLHAGHPLPPRIEPPGFRKRFWPVREVHGWLRGYLIDEDEQYDDLRAALDSKGKTL